MERLATVADAIDPTALAASRSAAAAIRVDAVAATGSAIRAVEEYQLAFTSVRPD